MFLFQLGLADQLSRPANAPIHVFGLKDEDGVGMDCLKVFQAPDGRIFGIYHHLTRDGDFALNLAETEDLIHWRTITWIDNHHSHQGTAKVFNDGTLVIAYEKDGPNGNWIRIKMFKPFGRFFAKAVEGQIDLPRRLSRFAEGTPSMESPSTADPLKQLRLRFHFYRGGVVDRQALGTLTNIRLDKGAPVGFGKWQEHADDALNAEGEALGMHGNFGDRDSFDWEGRNYHLFEGQLVNHDWSSWRIWLKPSGSNLRPLHITTPGRSTSFANPSTSLISLRGKRYLVVTMFLPSQGNARQEAGELLYGFPAK